MILRFFFDHVLCASRISCWQHHFESWSSASYAAALVSWKATKIAKHVSMQQSISWWHGKCEWASKNDQNKARCWGDSRWELGNSQVQWCIAQMILLIVGHGFHISSIQFDEEHKLPWVPRRRGTRFILRAIASWLVGTDNSSEKAMIWDSIRIHSLKLTACTWNPGVGSDEFSFWGQAFYLGANLLVLGSVNLTFEKKIEVKMLMPPWLDLPPE